MAGLKHWIHALRLRTIPLAIAGIVMGSILALIDGGFNIQIMWHALICAIFLQILSNLANDYGDAQHGADSEDRVGTYRVVQSGLISSRALFLAIIATGVLSLASGLLLLWKAELSTYTYLVFLVLGVFAIWAAIKYTMGNKPYGYYGLGDLSVFIFFGLLSVAGSYYLHTKSIDPLIFFPAISIGCFSVAVLNINNIRDMASDLLAGKYTLASMLGRDRAVVYHWMIVGFGIISVLVYAFFRFEEWQNWLFLASFPFFITNAYAVTHIQDERLNGYLKQMVFITLGFVVLFVLGVVV